MESQVKVKVNECELACELDRTNAAVAATTSSSRTGTGNLTRGISCLPKRRRATNNEVKDSTWIASNQSRLDICIDRPHY